MEKQMKSRIIPMLIITLSISVLAAIGINHALASDKTSEENVSAVAATGNNSALAPDQAKAVLGNQAKAVPGNQTKAVPGSQTEKPERIVTYLKTDHDAAWYARQAELWEKEVRRNPQNDDAWYFWFTATRYRLMHEGDNMQEYSDEPLKAIANRVHRERPKSFARYIIDEECGRLVNGCDGIEDHMVEAISMRPDFEELYPTYVAYLMTHGKDDMMADILERWYQSGTYSYTLLSYAYNCLAGMDPNGILLVMGDNETFSSLMVQYGKGLLQDRVVVNRTLMTFYPEYREKLCRQLGMDNYKGPEDYRQESLYKWEQGFISAIEKATGRSIYFTALSRPDYFHSELYSEGLVLKHSTRKYDNLSVKRRNYESVYLKDYLYETFVPENYVASAYRVNLNYIPSFKSLLDFYKSQGMNKEYNQLRGLMEHIIQECKGIEGFDPKLYYDEIER